MGEVILVHERHHIFYRHSLLCRHQHGALFGYRRMHAYRHMAVALVEESLQFVFHSHAAHGDSLRTPSEAIVGGEHLRHSQYIIEIVHRLSLPHEHHVGQLLPFGQRIYLVQYVGSGEVTLETLFSGDDTQSVALSPSGIYTVSTNFPLAVGKRYFIVPSTDF